MREDETHLSETFREGEAESTTDGPLVATAQLDGDQARVRPDLGEGAGAVGPASEQLRGVRIGRYVLLEHLGGGAMGRVYLAWDPDLARQVAIKVLRGSVAKAKSTSAGDPKRRMLREAQAAAQLVHPNVVAVHEAGVDRGAPFIAMEYVKGQSLRAWIHERNGGPRPWPEVLALFVEAGEGLAAAHAAGILHRDFKPDNVLVDEEGRPKVADFGLARRAETVPTDALEASATSGIEASSQLMSSEHLDARLTATGGVMGTPAYMAPEQHRAGPVDPRADVFAYCATLYEALWGQRPFDGDTIRKVYKAKMQGPPRPPTGKARVPRWLVEIVRAGLQPDLERRTRTIRELLNAIEAAKTRGHRRRVGAALGAVGLLGALIPASNALLRHRTRLDCTSQGGQILDFWTASKRDAVAAGLERAGATQGAEIVGRVMPWLDAYAQRWQSEKTQACLASRVERQPAWTQTATDHAAWCFEARRLAFEQLVETLENAGPLQATNAVGAAAGLPGPASCGEPDAVAAVPTPDAAARASVGQIQRGLASVEALAATGLYEEANTANEALATEAKAVAWPPLEAAIEGKRAYLSMKRGEYDAAATQYEDAYFHALDARADETAFVIANDYAFLLAEYKREPPRAKVWSRHAEALLDRLPDPTGLLRANHASNLGVIEEFANHPDRAIELHREALALRQEALGANHPDVARSMDNIAAAMKVAGRSDDTVAMFESSIAIKIEALGPNHPSVATSQCNLGVVLRDVDRMDDAERAIRRCLEIRERALGNTHTTVASALHNLAMVLATRGDDAQAQEAYRRSIEVWKAQPSGPHPELMLNYSNLGFSYLHTESYEEAQAAFEAALQVGAKAVPEDDAMLAYPITGLARYARKTGNYDEALRQYQRAIEIREPKLGADHVVVAFSYQSLADCAIEAGRPEQARAALEHALEIFAKVDGETHRHNGTPLQLLAELAIDQGQLDEAAARLDRLAKIEWTEERAVPARAVYDYLQAKLSVARGEDRAAAIAKARAAQAVLAERDDDDDREQAREVGKWIEAMADDSTTACR